MPAPVSQSRAKNSLNPVNRSLAHYGALGTAVNQRQSPVTELVSYTHQVPVASWDTGRSQQIPLGNATTDAVQILSILEQLAAQFGQAPYVRDAAITIISSDGGFGQNDSTTHANRLIAFVKDHTRYVKDPSFAEYVISPIVMLSEIDNRGFTVGDCDDHVLLLNSLLNSVGIDTRVLGIKLFAPDHYDHVVSSIRISNQWMDVDPCVKMSMQPTYQSRLAISG